MDAPHLPQPVSATTRNPHTKPATNAQILVTNTIDSAAWVLGWRASSLAFAATATATANSQRTWNAAWIPTRCSLNARRRGRGGCPSLGLSGSVAIPRLRSGA